MKIAAAAGLHLMLYCTETMALKFFALTATHASEPFGADLLLMARLIVPPILGRVSSVGASDAGDGASPGFVVLSIASAVAASRAFSSWPQPTVANVIAKQKTAISG